MWSVSKSLGQFLAYEALKQFFEKKFHGTLWRIFFYQAFPENRGDGKSYESTHAFFTYLKKNVGFHIRKKPLKQILLRDTANNLMIDTTGKPRFQEKGNFDVEITMDMVEHIEKYDIAILMSGDSDFLPVITWILKKNKKAYIFSNKHSVSRELRTGGSGYFDIAAFPEILGKKLVKK